jgi:hypothetical protein
MLSGAAGFSKAAKFEEMACGNVANCSAGTFPSTFSVAATYWLTPVIGIEGGYVRPLKMTADGGAETFRFDTELDLRFYTIGAKVGAPRGAVRAYGYGGVNRHQATLRTTQTNDTITVPVTGADGEQTVTIPGGTQVFELQTEGWGWQAGGGVEFWLDPRIALFGEGGLTFLKGSGQDNVEGELDERLIPMMFGVRVRLGG